MAASSAVCSWLMAACMSVACGNDSSVSMLSTASSGPSRLSKWAGRRRRRAVAGCAPQVTGIRNLMTSCLAFEPCDRFCKSSSASEFLFGFGSNDDAPGHRRRRKSHRTAVRSGNEFFWLFSLIHMRFLAWLEKPIASGFRL